MRRQLTISAVAISCVTLLAVGTAAADGWPASVSGNWTVLGNHSPGSLSITQFPGAPGSQCKPIRGFIYNTDVIEGFYCPNSGRIVFMRYIDNTNAPRQFWSGNLSQVGATLRMGGVFASFVHNNVAGTVGGSLGEYNFQASR
jgi:hypothetical protein